VRHTSTAILITNALTLKKSGKLWIYPSQAKQLQLLDKFHGIKIVDRTLRYHHLNHKNDGLTYRRRRWDRRDDGTVFMMTTGLCYTIPGYRYLLTLGNLWAKDRIKRLIQKYGPKSDSAKKPLRENPAPANRAPLKNSSPRDPEDP